MPLVDKEKKKAYDKKWKQDNKERINAQVNARRHENWEEYKAKVRAYNQANKYQLQFARFLREYNLTREDYEFLLKEQENRCLICNKEDSLVVDHCHTTGKVRALLCNKCNRGLGHFDDIPETLEKAAKYLRNFHGR